MTNTPITLQNKYFVLPINMHARCKKICLWEDGTLLFDFDAHVDPITPHFYAYINIERFKGKTVTVQISPEISLIPTFSDSITYAAYGEEFRPRVHFSARIGWINDPNGLVYANGKYHMFFQHNPAGSTWGNMTWGHAISRDLIHWEELDSALHPDEMGTMFSGSAIVDTGNVTGLKENENDPILLYYTAAGNNSLLSQGIRFTQCLAYSLDDGKTFRKYEKNPVIPHIAADNRDPKVVWCEEKSCYLLALYLEGNDYAVFESCNLLEWKEAFRLTLPNDGECPDLYPLTVENEEGTTKWIFSGASDHYLVGEITDSFHPVQEEKTNFYDDRRYPPKIAYAAQTFSGTGQRKLRMAWEVLHAPESVFENQMSIPLALSLVKKERDYYLRTYPAKEWDAARQKSDTYRIESSDAFSLPLDKGAYDIELSFPQSVNDFSIELFGYHLTVCPTQNALSYRGVTMPLSVVGDERRIRLISDVLGLEIFTDGGLAHSIVNARADYSISSFRIIPHAQSDCSGTVVKLHALKNIW